MCIYADDVDDAIAMLREAGVRVLAEPIVMITAPVDAG